MIHPSLAFPELAVAGEQAFARNGADGFRTAGLFVIVAGTALQHVFGVVRMVEQVDDVRAQPAADDVAVISGGLDHQPEHVFAELAQIP